MYIELWCSNKLSAKQRWYWHLKARNGKIVSDAEAFPTKAHAIRAAQAVVRGVVKRCNASSLSGSITVRFKRNVAGTRIDWS